MPEFDQPAGKRLAPLEREIRSFGVMQKERNALFQPAVQDDGIRLDPRAAPRFLHARHNSVA